MPERTIIDISPRTIWRVILAVLLLIAAYFARDILMLLFLSIVLASAIELPVKFFGRFRIPRIISVLIIYLFLALVLALIVYLLLPPLVVEIKNLATVLPPFVYQLSDGTLLPQLHFTLSDVASLMDNFSGWINSQTNIMTAVSGIFGGAMSATLVVVISFYLATQENGITKFLRLVLPEKNEQYVIDLWDRAQKKIGSWMQGQLLLAMAVGVLVYIGLLIVGVKYALSLALIATAFELVPFVGPVLAAIPAVVLALIQAPVLAFWTIILFVVVQQLESQIMAPLVMRRMTSLNPVIVILALVLGAQFGGIVGAILGVPVASILEEVIGDFNKRKSRAAR